MDCRSTRERNDVRGSYYRAIRGTHNQGVVNLIQKSIRPVPLIFFPLIFGVTQITAE